MLMRDFKYRQFGGPKALCEPATHSLGLSLYLDPEDEVGIVMEATISGNPDVEIRDHYVLPDWLEDAATQTGNYPIFSCSCGIPECSGYDSVIVEVGEKTVCWAWKRYRKLFIAVFDKTEIEKVARDAADDFAGLLVVSDGAKWDGRS